MKVILTGTTGFLGAALLRRCRELGIETIAVGRMPANQCVSDALAASGSFDGCVHLATYYLPSHAEEQIPDLVDANITFGTRMLEASVKLGCKWFVNAASFWQHAADGIPVNLYSAMKEAFQGIAAYYNAAYGLKVTNLELTDTYGENDPRKKLVNLWCNALNGKDVLPMSQGRQEIELVHKDDVVDAFLDLARMLDSGDERVSGSGETYYLPTEKMTLRETASVFENATRGVLPIQWGARPERAREIMKIEHRGMPLPGWRQKTDLPAGFARLYENFKCRTGDQRNA